MQNFLNKHFGRFGNRMFQLAYIYAQFKDGNIPDIYLQDSKYFEKYSEEIKKLFGENVGYNKNVSIHVRRGDYVDNPFYVDLMKTDYYQKAMKLFKGRKFIVFSDNPSWCKEQEIFKDCFFAEGNEIDDFNRMASCDGHIIANSSFSWWAAFIGQGTVVAPKAWYSDGIERTKCPENWVRI